jgi:hypothetical protein
MFNPADIYTASGSNVIQGCWTPAITKFDSSSFYNWEQDNLPLYDAEERTNLLWERLGHPASSTTGFSFVVSADATSACNLNIYTTLSGALARLPEVINAPYFIEVASFGNLGALKLSNKIFGPRGSIEIINRVFGHSESATSSTVVTEQVSATNSAYFLASAIQRSANYSLVDGPSLYHDLTLASAVSISTRVVSSTTTMDSRLSNNLTLFCRKTGPEGGMRLTAALAAKNTTTPWTGSIASNHKISFLPYEHNAETNDQINSFDASCINEISNSEIIWGNGSNELETVGLGYGNRLTNIEIFNCNGPIFIRNFTVDGNGASGSPVGIDIRNSTVYLENASVSRCSKAGLQALDSNVTLLRSFVAYRNYSFNVSSNRNGLDWLTKKQSSKFQTSSTDDIGAGILLVNSDLNLSSTYIRDAGLITTRLTTYGGGLASLLGIPTPAYSWLLCLSRNEIGLKAINSKIHGGKPEFGGLSLIPFYDSQQVFFELNTVAGIELENSKLSHSGKIHLLGNFVGLNANSSDIESDHIIAKYNQKEGVKLKNSYLRYNKDLYLPSNNNVGDDYKFHPNAYFLNGTHIKLENSTYEPTDTSSIPSVYELFAASASFGVTQSLTNQKAILPSIIVDSGSKLRIVHPVIETPDSYVEESKPSYGASIAVTNNSELVLQGSKNYTTKIIGPSTHALQKRKAGLFANNNSNIKIQGPTVIARYAVDILADNNSKVEFTPHKDGDGRIDVSGFNLSDKGNHTVVELHSTRACLVVDHGSVALMEKLGDYRSFWPSGTVGAASLLSGIDSLTNDTAEDYTAPYTSGGSIQFYPNPNDSAHYPPATANPTVPFYTAPAMSQNARGYYYFLEDDIGAPANAQNFSSVTLGGMCVRALNGSKVDVDNVHFPCGWWNPSGVIYDVSGDEPNSCNRLFIWNIADLSQINARLISVSGAHPADITYFGPSGTWGSASAAPISTPDTSSVSILDYYGRSNNHIFSSTTNANRGPFRFYFSTDPVANWLLTSSLTLSGYAPQVYSQGYQFSANMIIPGDVSALYKSIQQRSGNSLIASGFFYGSALLFSPNTIRAVIDESAANTFANAKHCSVGKSGLGKVVSIYIPYTNTYGGDSAQSSSKSAGRGVRSVNNFDLEKDN